MHSIKAHLPAVLIVLVVMAVVFRVKMVRELVTGVKAQA